MNIFNEKQELLNFIDKKSNLDYWKSFDIRWKYMSFVIDTIKELGIIENILEIGTNGLPLVKTSAQLELFEKNFTNEKRIIHDLNTFPFPFKDKQFQLSVALQVWEHLEDQIKSFQELKRISKNIILSFPYKWTNKQDKKHYNIDENIISNWTLNQPYSFRHIVTSEKGCCGSRIIYLWENL